MPRGSIKGRYPPEKLGAQLEREGLPLSSVNRFHIFIHEKAEVIQIDFQNLLCCFDPPNQGWLFCPVSFKFREEKKTC